MPNWMECEARIIGPTDEIARLRTAHIGNDQNCELQLDFIALSRCRPGGGPTQSLLLSAGVGSRSGLFNALVLDW